MSKDSWNDYSATASSNTDIAGIDLDENSMVPSDVNNALREIMKQIADVVAGTTALSSINIDGGTINGITDLAVADGGTGASTHTQHGVLVGDGNNAIVSTAAGSTGQALLSNGGSSAPSFGNIVSGGLGHDGAGTDETHVIRFNKSTISNSSSLTVASGTNGFSAGPITISANSSVTVNGVWHIIG